MLLFFGTHILKATALLLLCQVSFDKLFEPVFVPWPYKSFIECVIAEECNVMYAILYFWGGMFFGEFSRLLFL